MRFDRDSTKLKVEAHEHVWKSAIPPQSFEGFLPLYPSCASIQKTK